MIFFALLGHPALGEDTLFSGPQKGNGDSFSSCGVREPLQGKVVEVLGKGDSAKYRVLIFVHGLERSMALMQVVDAFLATDTRRTCRPIGSFFRMISSVAVSDYPWWHDLSNQGTDATV